MLAFVDESYSSPSGPGHAYVYVLAAVIIDPDQAEHARDATSALVGRSRKRHWYHCTPAMRAESVRVVREVASLCVTAELVHETAMRTERRRRLCMEAMLPELESLSVHDAVLESRGPADDGRDRNMLDAMRANHQVARIRMDHIAAPQEPRLWLADAVCGTAHFDLRGTPEYAHQLASGSGWRRLVVSPR